MKKLLSVLASGVFIVYFLTFFLSSLYFNWQYARDHGFLSWLFLGEIIATGQAVIWPYSLFIAADSPFDSHYKNVTLAQYTDAEYGYAFQFPSNWKITPSVHKGELGELRVLVKSPDGDVIAVTVSQIDKSISRELFVKSGKGNEVVNAMVEYVIENVYKKPFEEVNVSRMIVKEKRTFSSDLAIKFLVSSVHFVKTDKGEVPMFMAGLHYVPFGKPHLITCMITSTIDPKATSGSEVFERIFSTFHLSDEKSL